MTRCNLKLGLYLWAAALFAAFPVCTQPALAASNKVVQDELDAYNKKSLITDQEKKTLSDSLKAAKEKCGLSFENAKLWAKVQKFQKINVSWYAVTAEKYNSGFSAFFSSLGNYYDNLWENWESLQVWSGYLNTMQDIERQINYYHNDAIDNAKGDLEAIEKINKEFKEIMAEYKELYNATDSVRNACNELNTFDKDALKALENGLLYKSIYCPKGEKDLSKCQTILYTYDEGNAKTLKGNSRGCIPLPMKLAESKSCIFCPLFKTIFNAAQTMATQSYAALANAIANVLLIGLAIWIAFSVMAKVSSFTKMDTPKFITELLTQIFKVMVAYLLLRNADFVYSTIIGPLLKAGMEFGMSLLFETGSSYLNACGNADTMKNLSGGLLPSYLYTQLECFIQAVQAELAIPQSVGSTLMCVSRHAASKDLGAVTSVTDVRMPDFGMMIQGLIIWVFAWLVSLAFAFYLIDATVRLGIVGALMPFLIASWPFKVTSKYTSQGWSMFMNTFFTFVFMGLVVSVNVQLMGHSLGGAGGFDSIIAAINSNEIDTLTQLLDIGFAGFLILIASCIFGFKLTAQATELAGSMAGGGSSAIGANIGGLAASAAKAGTLGAGKATWGATKMAGNVTGVTPKLRQARDSAKAWVGKKLGFGGKSSGAASKPTVTSSSSPTTSNPQNPSNPNNPNNGGFSINGNPTQANAVQNAAPRTPTTTPSTTTPTTTTPSTGTPTTAPDPSKGHNAKLGQDQNSKPQPEQNDQFKAEQARLAGMDAKSLVATGAVNSLYRASNEGKLLKNATDAAQARIGANSKDYADNMKAAAGERNAAAALKNRAAMSGPGDIRDGMLKDAADHEQKAQKFEQDAAKAAKGITDAQKSYDDLQKLNSEARKQFVNNTAIPGSYSPLDYGKVDGNIANILKNNEGL